MTVKRNDQFRSRMSGCLPENTASSSSVPSSISIIVDLLNNPFCRRDFQTKNAIVRTERPTPDITLTTNIKNKGKPCVRHFQKSLYDKFHWMTACFQKNKLYCWPCLLFVHNAKDKSIWVLQGYNDLNHVHEAAKKHEKTQTHISSVIALKTFGNVRVDVMLDKVKALSIVKHNEQVTKNRNILKRLIDVVCFLGKQECSFRGHDESTGSLNRGNFIELLHLISKYDELLAHHLSTATVFTGTSNRIQNDILQSLNNILIAEIKKEVAETEFVAIMLDETSDISHKSQLSVVLRYIESTGKPVERFLFFKDVSADRSANALSRIVQEIILNWGCENKLIAQTYDGAAVMAGELNGTQKKVKDMFPDALFVHCCAHVLNLVLSQSVTFIKECKIFFATISGMSAFFSVSTKRNYALNEIVKKKFPKLATTRWNYSSRIINTITNERQLLCEFFESIIDNPENWDNDTISMAKGYSKFFEEFNSQFLLLVFAKIFCYTDVLFDILQKSTLDITYAVQKINEVKTTIADLRNNFDEFYRNTISIVGPPQVGRQRALPAQEIELHFKRIYCEIFDTIYQQLQLRFEKLTSLKFFELLNPKFFDRYKKQIPEACINSLKEQYGKYFDFNKLINELSVVYQSESFQNLSISELIIHIKNYDLADALSEVLKLGKLILTIPFSTASVERSFSALKRIKSYSRNTTSQDRLSNLGLITIEKDVLSYLQSKPDFYENIINDFVKNAERRIELSYK